MSYVDPGGHRPSIDGYSQKQNAKLAKQYYSGTGGYQGKGAAAAASTLTAAQIRGINMAATKARWNARPEVIARKKRLAERLARRAARERRKRAEARERFIMLSHGYRPGSGTGGRDNAHKGTKNNKKPPFRADLPKIPRPEDDNPGNVGGPGNPALPPGYGPTTPPPFNGPNLSTGSNSGSGGSNCGTRCTVGVVVAVGTVICILAEPCGLAVAGVGAGTAAVAVAP